MIWHRINRQATTNYVTEKGKDKKNNLLYKWKELYTIVENVYQAISKIRTLNF